MKITTKGQVTIPQEIREKYGLWPQTEVEFVEQGNRVVIRKASGQRTRGQQIVNRLRGTSDVKMSTEEIMKLTRG
jgi:AbrB family looped-hinge helix DNA binding protein